MLLRRPGNNVGVTVGVVVEVGVTVLVAVAVMVGVGVAVDVTVGVGVGDDAKGNDADEHAGRRIVAIKRTTAVFRCMNEPRKNFIRPSGRLRKSQRSFSFTNGSVNRKTLP